MYKKTRRPDPKVIDDMINERTAINRVRIRLVVLSIIFLVPDISFLIYCDWLQKVLYSPTVLDESSWDVTQLSVCLD